MSDTIIKVENLSKKYIISHQQQGRYTALRDVITQGARNFGRKILSPFSNAQPSTTEEFFALKDVSFEIKQGDRVGIIGRNGAGKSTLLKILSRITEPTSGRIEITGRVASLLEVGTGFHPELTGRENIYLNGAILGMTRREIKAKFDEIVVFAEVEKFLDTPVKRFSSGMYVRLAFAIAAHLEPEILVVDEVLAVGDASFQKKCLGKMEDVAHEGRTILFVSHNMAAVENLCSKSLLLDNGKIVISSDTRSVIDKYLRLSIATTETKKLTSADIDLMIDVIDQDDIATNSVKCGFPIAFNINICSKRKLSQMDFTLAIFNLNGQRILTFDSRYQVKDKFNITKQCKCIIKWDKNILCPGDYVIGMGVYENGRYLTGWENAIQLKVLESDYYVTGKLPDSGQGYILTDTTWVIE